MKCPYRTRKTVIVDNACCTGPKTTETVEFEECLKEECPFYGQRVMRLNQATLRLESMIAPGCRRCDTTNK